MNNYHSGSYAEQGWSSNPLRWGSHSPSAANCRVGRETQTPSALWCLFQSSLLDSTDGRQRYANARYLKDTAAYSHLLPQPRLVYLPVFVPDPNAGFPLHGSGRHAFACSRARRMRHASRKGRLLAWRYPIGRNREGFLSLCQMANQKAKPLAVIPRQTTSTPGTTTETEIPLQAPHGSNIDGDALRLVPFRVRRRSGQLRRNNSPTWRSPTTDLARWSASFKSATTA